MKTNNKWSYETMKHFKIKNNETVKQFNYQTIKLFIN